MTDRQEARSAAQDRVVSMRGWLAARRRFDDLRRQEARSAAQDRRFTVEGDPSDVFAFAERFGLKVTHPRWWERTYAVPRWLVWLAAPLIAYHAILGLHLIVEWAS